MDDALVVIIETVLQTLAAGVLVGFLYGLMCVGLGMIFGVMRVINFAQGDFMMLGMYVAIIVAGMMGGFSPYITAVFAAMLAGAVVFVAGYFVQILLLSKATGASDPGTSDGHYTQLVLTLGLALVMQNAALIYFGSTPRTISSPLSSTAWQINFGDIYIFLNQGRVLAALVAILVSVVLFLFVTRTSLGRALRAAADNPNAAVYVGVRVDRAHRLAFAIGTGITAIAGALLATYYTAQPFIGLEFVIVMYAGVVLGGMGSILGAFWGGMTIGIVQQLSSLLLPTQLQNTTIFVVFLAILLFRPEGFFGRSAERT